MLFAKQGKWWKDLFPYNIDTNHNSQIGYFFSILTKEKVFNKSINI